MEILLFIGIFAVISLLIYLSVALMMCNLKIKFSTDLEWAMLGIVLVAILTASIFATIDISAKYNHKGEENGMTWNEIYKRAKHAGCGDPELKAKDTARWKVGILVDDLTGYDIEKDDIPEDTVEDICYRLNIRFDEEGNIVSITLPDWVSELTKGE